jgi:hypothetical protein
MKKIFICAAALAALVLSGCQGGNIPANTSMDGNSQAVSENQNVTSTEKVAEDSADLEGTIRPAEAPADLPSPDKSYDFNYYDSGSVVSFSYKVQNDNLLSVCDDIEAKLKTAGWQRSREGMNSEDADNIYRAFANDKYKLTESCSLTDNVPDIALIRNLKK